MKVLIALFNIFGGTLGLVAAWFWFCSARVEYPEGMRGIAPTGGLVSVNTQPMTKALKASARLNKLGAGFSGLAALLLSAAAILSAFGLD